MTAVAAEAAVVVDNGRETSGETSLWHGAAAGAAARVDPLLRRINAWWLQAQCMGFSFQPLTLTHVSALHCMGDCA